MSLVDLFIPSRLAELRDLRRRLASLEVSSQTLRASLIAEVRRVRRVRALHTADEFGTECMHCQVRWPCPTIEAVGR